jgi:hypothetical protein
MFTGRRQPVLGNIRDDKQCATDSDRTTFTGIANTGVQLRVCQQG